MRTVFCQLLAAVAALTFASGCDESMSSNYYDLGSQTFKRIGQSCLPDTPPTSECGYAPQFYCSAGKSCASACNTNADCRDGSICVGSGDMIAGECRQPATVTDGGQD